MSRLGGHTTIGTTEIYAHMIDRALLHGVSQLEKSMRDSASTERKKERMGIKEQVKKTILPLLRRRGRECFLQYKQQTTNTIDVLIKH